MEENLNLDGTLAHQWGATVRAYCELMDDVMPHLPDSEQIVYHRLFRLSHAQQSPFVKCRYEDLAPQCGVSLSTVRRAVKGLRAKKLIKTLWQSHSGTTFQVHLLCTLPHRPAFLPQPWRGGNFPPSLGQPSRPPIYDAFSPEDRALFIDCKQRLGPAGLNELVGIRRRFRMSCLEIRSMNSFSMRYLGRSAASPMSSFLHACTAGETIAGF